MKPETADISKAKKIVISILFILNAKMDSAAAVKQSRNLIDRLAINQIECIYNTTVAKTVKLLQSEKTEEKNQFQEHPAYRPLLKNYNCYQTRNSSGK